MLSALSRRRLLRTSAMVAPALACTGMVRDAAGTETPRIEVPVVDRLVMQVVLDGAHDIFISGG